MPVQPPEAAQLCASVALHCRVVDVPMATLVFIAVNVTVGFASGVTPGIVKLVVLLDDDWPQAANADSAATERANFHA